MNIHHTWKQSQLALIVLALVLVGGAGKWAWGQELPVAFNGQDLTGWVVPEGNVWWQVEDGMLRAKSDPDKQGSILWTKHEYRDFVMQLQFKFGEGTIDSGVFVRNENEQIQIGISGSLKRDMTGSPYIGSKGGYPVEAEGVKELLKLDGWNAMTIVARGGDYTVWLNGRHVMQYRSTTAIEKGPLGIQLHPGRDMAIDFRNIRLAELE